MKVVLVSVLVLSVAVCLVMAQGPPRGGRGGGRGKGGRGGPPHMMMFESCKTFKESMDKKFQELKKSREIGPAACKAAARQECMKQDQAKVRCALQEGPSEECLQEVTDFLHGNNCSEAEVETAQYD